MGVARARGGQPAMSLRMVRDEIIATERSYVRDMLTVADMASVLREQVSGGEGGSCTLQDLATVFSISEQIAQLNAQLLDDMEREYSEGGSIATLFSSWAGYLKM